MSMLGVKFALEICVLENVVLLSYVDPLFHFPLVPNVFGMGRGTN